MSSLSYALWLLAPICQLGLLIFMLRRKLRTEFPFFFTYTVYQVISFTVLYCTYHFAPNRYFDAYWTSSALSIVLGFLVIQEVFTYAIRPYAGLRDLGRLLFRWVSMLLLLVAGLMAVSSSGITSRHLLMVIVDVERAVRLMQCGLLVFIFMSSAYLGLTWRNFASGIALGYGTFAATELVVYTLRMQLGGGWNARLGMITSVVYCLSVMIWVAYAAMPEKVMQRVHNEVVYRPIFDRWNQAALVLTAPMAPNEAAMMGSHHYLTEIEQAVDNIMAQTEANAANHIH
jgi:hypothetical protein